MNHDICKGKKEGFCTEIKNTNENWCFFSCLIEFLNHAVTIKKDKQMLLPLNASLRFWIQIN